MEAWSPNHWTTREIPVCTQTDAIASYITLLFLPVCFLQTSRTRPCKTCPCSPPHQPSPPALHAAARGCLRLTEPAALFSERLCTVLTLGTPLLPGSPCPAKVSPPESILPLGVDTLLWISTAICDFLT